METINFKKEKIPFTQVANEVLNDTNLSFKAKGLYAYLYSKPEGWDFESGRIAKEAHDGRDGVRSGLKELENAGYLRRYKTPVGRMVYLLVANPMTEKPSQEPMTEKANDGKSHSGESRRISNKEDKVIKKSLSNKEVNTSFLEKEFDTFWSNYPRKIGKGFARKSWLKLKPDLKIVLEAVEKQKQSRQWESDNGKFIPHPATWLNQERWEDEVEEESNKAIIL